MRESTRRDDLMEPLPAGASEAPKAIFSVWGLFEMLLKAPDRLNPYLRLPELQTRFCFSFALITLICLTAHALVLYGAMAFAPPDALPGLLAKAQWVNSPAGAASLLAAYPGGVILATLLLLPSYWFVGLLVGVRMPMNEVLAHSFKGKAATGMLLIGLTPVYAVIMSCLILGKTPAPVINSMLWFGLLMPFVAGLRGAGAIEDGFRTVANTTPDLTRDQRYAIPSSLMLLWAVLFTLTAPLVMYRACEWTLRGLAG